MNKTSTTKKDSYENFTALNFHEINYQVLPKNREKTESKNDTPYNKRPPSFISIEDLNEFVTYSVSGHHIRNME